MRADIEPLRAQGTRTQITKGPGVRRRWCFAFAALLCIGGCTSVRPVHVSIDRMEYGQEVAESWKRQTLFNIVRMRYGDAPVFLEVSSIINSYSVGGKANAEGDLQGSPMADLLKLGAEGTWSNSPTVTYQPMVGDRFTRSLLQPVPPAAIFQLLQGGWPAEIVMRTTVGSVNGLRNDYGALAADAEFTELTDTLMRIQRERGLGIRVDPGKAGSAIVVVLGNADKSVTPTADSRRLRELLGLDPDVREINVTYGLLNRNRAEVAILSRSMLEIMLSLGFSIDLPPAHVKDGRVLPGPAPAASAPFKPLVRIHSGTAPPPDPYTAVRYKSHWFWIDDQDIASKRVFAFLLIVFSLAETGQVSTAPVVTVPSR